MSVVQLTEPPRHIAIVLLTGLGDVIHGLPVVNALRRHWPEARITWIVEPMPAGVLRPHPAIDQVVVFEKRRGWRGVRELRARLRPERFDLALNLNIYFKSVFPTLFTGAPVRLGFDFRRARDGVWLAANRRLPRQARAHTQDMFLEFPAALGIDAEPLEWRLQITEDERAMQRRFREQMDGAPYVALVAASGNARKDWLPERAAQVVDAVYSEFRHRVVLIGGPGTRERGLAAIVERRATHTPVNALGDGVRRLIWQLEAARLLIAPDTGPVHIARALETPVVGLYGHTNPWRVGPYRASQDLWVDTYTDPGEEPDPTRFDPKHGRMERITVDMVLEKVARALVPPAVAEMAQDAR
ncbi:MAG TPA: glycosyltransferase family 9 protein [Longimicrobiales bacterium]|nr:glycosyltransferase family 9 protein [Longimicrobiales bacterium]